MSSGCGSYVLRGERGEKLAQVFAPLVLSQDMEATLTRRRFRAMGTEVELLFEADGAAHHLAAAETEFHRIEALLTRFRPDSELSRLNTAGRLAAGPDLLRVVELALAARERTGGRFDINVHDALLAAGYDRSFELLSLDHERPARPAVGV